jgi:hypothetical protein
VLVGGRSNGRRDGERESGDRRREAAAGETERGLHGGLLLEGLETNADRVARAGRRAVDRGIDVVEAR